MESVKRNLLWLVILVSFLLTCFSGSFSPSSPQLTEIKPVVMWKTGEVYAAPIAVDSVRITVTSSGLSEPLIKTFPFSSNEGTLGFVRSGLTVTIKLEGLTSDGRVLYSGEQICDAISGKSFTVQIEASEVTPVPPENPQSMSSTFSLMISWSDVSNNEAGYIIYRRVHGRSSFEAIDTVRGLSYIDTSISDSLSYDYRIFSFNEVGISVIFTDIENLSLKVNHKPEFSTVPLDSQKVKLGNSYWAPVKATDPDSGDSVRLSFSNKLELIKDTLRWNFSKSDTGINKFFITVFDRSGDSARYDWNVLVMDTAGLEKNTAPQFTTQISGPDTVEIENSYSRTLAATDADGDSITFSKENAPQDMELNTSSGRVTWFPDTLGLFTVVIIAEDDSGAQDKIEWQIQVRDHFNLVTKISDLKDSAKTGTEYLDTILCNLPGAKFYLKEGPDDLQIDSLSGAVSWTPGTTGQNTVKVTTVYKGETLSITWTITVKATNSAPRFITEPEDLMDTIAAGIIYKDTLLVEDDDNSREFTRVTGPASMGIDSNGIIVWDVPDSLRDTTVQIKIKVTDPEGEYDTLSWGIFVKKPNASPTITTRIENLKSSITAGKVYKDTIAAGDKESEEILFKVVSGPPLFEINSSGAITWAVPVIFPDTTIQVKIKIFDPDSASDSISWEITVDGNASPVINTKPASLKNSVKYGSLYEDSLSVTDEDGDALTFSCISGQSITFEPTGKFKWEPDSSSKGHTVEVTIKVSDPAGAFDTVKWSIDVLTANVAPEITSQAADMKNTVVAGELYKDTVEASDQDEDALTFSVQAGPSGLTIGSSTGIITWTPDTSLKSENVAVTIKVSDPAGAFDTVKWSIDILIPNIAPEISSQIGDMKKTAIAEEQYVDTVEASDQNGDELTFTVKTGPSGLTIDPSSGIITWTSETALQGDNFTVTIKVSDQQGAYDTLSWEIAVNTPPNFTTMMENLETSAVWGVIYEELLEAEDNDAGDELTYSVVDGPASVNSTSGLVTWTPGPSDESVSDSTHIKIRVTDKAGQYDEISWLIWVYANGRPNFVYKTMYDTVYFNTSHTDTAKFRNYEDEPLTWEYTPSDGIDIEYQEGPVFTWKASKNGTIRIIVSDPWNSDTSELQISVIVSHSVNITGFLEFDSRGVPEETFAVTIPTVVCVSDIETHPVKYKFFLPNGSQTNWSSMNTINQIQNSFGIYQYKVAARCTVDTTEVDTSEVGYVPILNVNCDTANLVLIDNCDLETNKNILGFDWRAVSDQPVGGNSTLSNFDMDPVTYYYDYYHTSSSGHSNSGGASISYTLGNDVIDLNGNALEPHVFLETRLAPDGSYKNLSAATKIRFRAKCNSGTVNVRFQVLTPQVANGDYFGKNITLTTSWQSFEIKNYVDPSDPNTGAPGDLKQKGYGGIVGYYRNQAQSFRWKISEDGNSANNGITVDDLTLEDWNYIP